MSVLSSFAASRRVNPSGVTPVLIEAQLWKGLGIKARNPQSFVPMITSCEIISDDGDKIVRSVRFNNGEPVTERIELHASTIAYFEMELKGNRITNVVSYDGEGELMLTFSFANGIPGVNEAKSVEELNKTVGRGVEHTISRIRELVVEGVI